LGLVWPLVGTVPQGTLSCGNVVLPESLGEHQRLRSGMMIRGKGGTAKATAAPGTLPSFVVMLRFTPALRF